MSLTSLTLTPVSGNRKTGPIPVTSRVMAETCPTDCPFLPRDLGGNGGCYGTGRIAGQVSKGALDLTAEQADQILAKRRKSARFLRDRVVGDILTDGRPDFGYIAAITGAARRAGLRVFGYTHAWDRLSADDVTRVKQEGYALNASCETAADVEEATAKGMDVVLTGNDWTDGDRIAGRRIVTCPAENNDDVTCASCGMCAVMNRRNVVRFHTHSGSARLADKSIEKRKGE